MKNAFLSKVKTNKHRQCGVTLVELVISIIVLSIAMVALMNAFSVSMLSNPDPLWRNKTIKLAQLYLDEILAKNYDHNSPVGEPYIVTPSCGSLGPDSPSGIAETRETYNDVDDYDELTESPVSLIGAIDSSYSAYQVSIQVECKGDQVAAVDSGNSPASEHAKKITVTITPPGQAAIPFTVYKGNF